MSNEKKIVFSGEGSALLKIFDQVRAKRKELGLDDEKFAKVSKENANQLIKSLQLEIRERERLNKIQKESALLGLDERRRERIASGWDPSRANKSYSTSAFNLKQDMCADKTVINDLKTLIEETRQNLTKEEIKPESKSIFKDVLAANLVTEGIKQAIKGIANGIGNFGSSIAGATDDTKFTGALYGGLVGATYFGAGMAPMVQAANDREEQEKKSRALNKASRKAIVSNESIGANIGLGLDSGEADQLAAQYARASGSGRSLRENVFESYAIQKSFGLDQGSMIDQEKLSRITGTQGAQNVANIITTMKRQGIIKGNDYSDLPQLIQTQNQFLQEQSKLMSNPNSINAASMVATMRQIGGGFTGERLGERMSTINQSLISPQGDFGQAMSFSALTSLPGGQNASYFDLVKKQQGGLGTEGFLGAMLKQLSDQYGGASSEGFKVGAMDMLGLGAEDTERLTNFYKNNPDAFNKFSGSVGDVQKLIGSRDSGVTKYEQQQAIVGEAFSTGAINGMLKSAEIAGAKISEEILDVLGVNISKNLKDNKPKSGKHGHGESW